MNRILTAALLTVAAACGLASAEEPSASPAISAEARLAARGVRVPAGFHVEPVASEPHLANPVAFCFDPQGRIFVAETYRVNKGVEDNRHHMDWLDDDLASKSVADRRAYTVRRMGDQIGKFTEFSEQVRLLEDRDRDSQYETSSVFADGFNAVEDGAAAGVMWMGDRLWFTCIPTLWELRDADDDGKADERKQVATGFGIRNAFYGHDMHGLVQGPDGKIYFSIGDRGLHVETPAGVLDNPESGAILRCNPDGSEMEIFATGFRNPQELAFNEYGDLFTVDNNSDSGDRARLIHIVEGMDSGWRMAYQYLPDRGPYNRERVWEPQNDAQPASIIPPLANISDGPSGLAYYPGTGLPEKYQGAFFLCDFRGAAANSGVRAFWVKPHGASYAHDRNEMFAEGVLATDCEFGPDGEFYILDWIEGWEGTGKGRIFRVTREDAAEPSARRDSQSLLRTVAKLSAPDLLTLLEHPNLRVRLAAQQQLVATGAQAAADLSALASAVDAPELSRVHAVWALGQLAEEDPQLFKALTALADDENAEVRAQAAKTLGRAARASAAERDAMGLALIPLLQDKSPRVRRFAAVSLGTLRFEPARDSLLALARESGDSDPTLRHAAVMGLAGSQSSEALEVAAEGAPPAERLCLLLALGRQKSPLVARFLDDEDPRVVTEAARVIWDTPIPQAFGDLARSLSSAPSGNEPLLRRAVAARNSQGDRDSLDAVIECALRSDLSPDLRQHAWELVRHWHEPSPRDPVLGMWRPLEALSWEELAASLRAALPKLSATGADATGLVVAAEIGVQEAYAPLATALDNPQASDALRFRGMAALGSADEATVRKMIDAGLKSQQPVVRAAARGILARRFPAEAATALRDALESGEPVEQKAAIDALASIEQPASRELLVQWMERVERGDCPPALILEVVEAAVRSTDAALAERGKAYDAQLADAAPAVAYAACLQGGDAARGEKLFTENATLSCRRCHSPAPGELLVGPSLADVGLRLKREELLESIVAPNNKIAEGFKTTVMQLDTGLVVAGIVRREDEQEAALVNAEGKEIVVDLATVEERFEGKSAMPEDLLQHLSRRDLRDIVEYLSTLRTLPTATEGHGTVKNN